MKYRNQKAINYLLISFFVFAMYSGVAARSANATSDNLDDGATTKVAEPITWNIWPDKAPGEVKELEPEYDTTKRNLMAIWSPDVGLYELQMLPFHK